LDGLMGTLWLALLNPMVDRHVAVGRARATR
jgi:hypothetical protein